MVTSRERPRDRGRRRGERLCDDLLREARDGRIARNLSQLSVGKAVGLSDSQISLIERGGHPDVPFVVVAQLRDSGFTRSIILVAATRSNRLTLREFGAGLHANYPIASASAPRALGAGEDPGGNSVIVL
jgi:hypothetical protein